MYRRWVLLGQQSLAHFLCITCFWCVSFSFMEPATVAAQGAVCARVFGVFSNALDAALLRRRLSGAVLWLGLCHVPPTTWSGLLRKSRGVMPSSLMSRLSCWFDAACRSFAGQGVYSILAAADSASRCLCFVFLGLLRKLKQWLPRGKVFRRCVHETSLFLYKDRAVELTVVRRDWRKGQHW